MPSLVVHQDSGISVADSGEELAVTLRTSPQPAPIGMKEERSGSTASSGIVSLSTSSSLEEDSGHLRHSDALSCSPTADLPTFADPAESLNPQEAVEKLAIALSMTVLREPNEPYFGSTSVHGVPIAYNAQFHHRSYSVSQHCDNDSGHASGDNSGDNIDEHFFPPGFNMDGNGSPPIGYEGAGVFNGTGLPFGSEFSLSGGSYPQTAAEWAMRRGSSSSLNVTDNVQVPSSEHVAEIVGRQGCKIKALRAKTNTYIKTPVRGEEAVFVVTGRREDVEEAKKEILEAAEHFTQIRASRRQVQGGQPAPGHVTAYVRVPYRVVGLVVGPKGGTIKRIQQDTHTYIITPSRDREPIFEVTGLPDNVVAARKEIEKHILNRTGNLPITESFDGSYDYSRHLKGIGDKPSEGSPSPTGISSEIQGGNAIGMGYGGRFGVDDFQNNGIDSDFFGSETNCSVQNPVISKPTTGGDEGFGGSIGSQQLSGSLWGQSIFPPTTSLVKSSMGPAGSLSPSSAATGSYPIWSNGGNGGFDAASQQHSDSNSSYSCRGPSSAALGSTTFGCFGF